MNYKKILTTSVPLVFLSGMSAYGSAILASLGTAPGTANVNEPGIVIADGSSHTYLVGFLDDPTVSWNQTGGLSTADSGNPNSIVGTQMRISVTNTVGAGRVVVNPKGTNGGMGGGSTINLAVLDGGISEFTITMEYLNAAGNPTGVTGLPFTSDIATPILEIQNNTADLTSFDFSLLDVTGTPLTTDFVAGAGTAGSGTHIVGAGSTLANTSGVYSDSFNNLEGLNIQRFATTPTNEADDLYSTMSVTFFSNDADGLFDHNSIFTLSFDSRILQVDGVAAPEPSSVALLGLGMVGLTSRRKRSQ